MIKVIKDNTKQELYTVCASCLSELTYAFKDVKIEETDFSYTPNRTIKCPACGKETVAEMRTKDEYTPNYIERLKMPNVALNSCCCNDSK